MNIRPVRDVLRITTKFSQHRWKMGQVCSALTYSMEWCVIHSTQAASANPAHPCPLLTFPLCQDHCLQHHVANQITEQIWQEKIQKFLPLGGGDYMYFLIQFKTACAKGLGCASTRSCQRQEGIDFTATMKLSGKLHFRTPLGYKKSSFQLSVTTITTNNQNYKYYDSRKL